MLRILACLAFSAALVSGFVPSGGKNSPRPAFAQSQADIKAAMLESSLVQIEHWMGQARNSVENGDWHGVACHTVLLKAFGVAESSPEDEAAMAVATDAIEACTHQLPVTHFNGRIDLMESDQGDGSNCELFASDAREIFWMIAFNRGPLAVADYESNSSDEERRFKAALSERFNKVCPEQAAENRY